MTFYLQNNNALTSISANLLVYHSYITLEQSMMSNCQKNKNLEGIIFRNLNTNYINKKNLKCDFHSHHFSATNYLLDENFYQNYNKNLISMESNKEYYIKENNSEIWLKFEINQDLTNGDLILKVDPRNLLFFGIICFSQDLNDERTKSCYNINTRNAFNINIDIEETSKNLLLFCQLKGKLSGFIELLNLSKPKNLDINYSYYFPKIDSISPEKSLN